MEQKEKSLKVADFMNRCRYWEARIKKDGFPIGNICEFKYHYKLKPLGYCKYIGRDVRTNEKCFHLAFSFAEVEMDKKSQDSTIIHEIIHTFPRCLNHGQVFHEYASVLSERYDVEIGTYASRDEWQAYQKTDYYKNSVRFMYRLMVPPYTLSSALRMKNVIKAIKSPTRDYIDTFRFRDGKTPCYFHLLRDCGKDVEAKRIYSKNVPSDVIEAYEEHFYGEETKVAAQKPKEDKIEAHDDMNKPFKVIEQLSLF